MTRLAEQIIVRDYGIEVHFKCVMTASREWKPPI